MDLQTLSNLFGTTLSGDVNARRAAELEIMKVSLFFSVFILFPGLHPPSIYISVYGTGDALLILCAGCFYPN